MLFSFVGDLKVTFLSQNLREFGIKFGSDEKNLFFCKRQMVETNRRYEIVEGRPELQVELTCTNRECGNVWIRRFPTE